MLGMSLTGGAGDSGVGGVPRYSPYADRARLEEAAGTDRRIVEEGGKARQWVGDWLEAHSTSTHFLGYRLYVSECWSCGELVGKLGPSPLHFTCWGCDVSWFAPECGGVEQVDWSLRWTRSLRLSR